MNLKETIEKYVPYNEQEAKDKETMLKYINTFDDVLLEIMSLLILQHHHG